MLSLQQLDSLRDSLGQLLGDSVPTLIQVQKMEKQFGQLSGLSSRVGDGLSIEEFDKLSAELVRVRKSLTEIVSAARWPDSTRDTREKTLTALDRLEENALEMLPYRASMLVARARLDQIRKELGQLRRDFSEVSAPLVVEPTVPKGEEASQGQEWPVISRSHDNRVVEYVTRLDAIINATIRLASGQPDELGVPIAERLMVAARSAAGSLADFEPGGARERLIVLTDRLQSILSAPDGALSVAQTLRTNSSRFAARRLVQLELLKEASLLADSLSAVALKEIDQSGRSLRHAFTIALATLAATGLISILVIAAVSYVVVERQINQRMSKLIESVRAIAGGDTKRRVDVYGSDELGEMARALEVFKENATELRRSNEELEKFAYAASHDLRSPLRAIENLALWTLEDARDYLPAESRANLEKLLSRVNRLSQLQTDLLDYSRAGKAEEDLAPVDTLALVDDLTELLDPEHKFKVSIDGDTSPAITFVTPLRQIMMNLLTNAIKHHDRGAGVLTISVARRAARIIYIVSDDGPGIEPLYHERIFGLFQTLRPRDEVEGSGLGLSLIQKLVERYGGTVTVTSDPAVARGASFRFDLPAIDGTL